MTGYYEWATENGPFAPKQPFYIHSRDVLALAGIFDRWVDSNGEIHESCSIITRPAIGQLAEIHHRMPTFITHERWSAWLNPEPREEAELRIILDDVNGASELTQEVVAELAVDPVSTQVNYTRNLSLIHI